MYVIFTYICAIFGVNVGKYSVHGAFGNSECMYIYIIMLCNYIMYDIDSTYTTISVFSLYIIFNISYPKGWGS
jgi:hypothetical protein